jgi:60 kDa SS-A/Ro ribonucleoprotein
MSVFHAAAKACMVNVASARNGVGYGRRVHVDGFSEAILGFIRDHERLAGRHAEG